MNVLKKGGCASEERVLWRRRKFSWQIKRSHTKKATPIILTRRPSSGPAIRGTRVRGETYKLARTDKERSREIAVPVRRRIVPYTARIKTEI